MFNSRLVGHYCKCLHSARVCLATTLLWLLQQYVWGWLSKNVGIESFLFPETERVTRTPLDMSSVKYVGTFKGKTKMPNAFWVVEHAVIHRHSKNFCPGPTFPFGGFTLVMCILSGHFIQEIRAQTYQSCQKCGFQLIKLKHEDLGCAGNLWESWLLSFQHPQWGNGTKDTRWVFCNRQSRCQSRAPENTQGMWCLVYPDVVGLLAKLAAAPICSEPQSL